MDDFDEIYLSLRREYPQLTPKERFALAEERVAAAAEKKKARRTPPMQQRPGLYRSGSGAGHPQRYYNSYQGPVKHTEDLSWMSTDQNQTSTTSVQTPQQLSRSFPQTPTTISSASMSKPANPDWFLDAPQTPDYDVEEQPGMQTAAFDLDDPQMTDLDEIMKKFTNYDDSELVPMPSLDNIRVRERPARRPVQSGRISKPKLRASPRARAANKDSEQNVESTTKSRSKQTAICDICDSDFASAHEMRRHKDRAHKGQRFYLVDPDQDRNLLQGCKRCEIKHLYGAPYNATAHLERRHLHPKKPKRGVPAFVIPHGYQFKDFAKTFVQKVQVADDAPPAVDDVEDDVPQAGDYSFGDAEQTAGPTFNDPTMFVSSFENDALDDFVYKLHTGQIQTTIFEGDGILQSETPYDFSPETTLFHHQQILMNMPMSPPIPMHFGYPPPPQDFIPHVGRDAKFPYATHR